MECTTESWASLRDTRSPDEDKLVRKGEAQLNKGQPVSWTHART
jgi:hypothetical protein